MPYSADEGKTWTFERVVALKPDSVLDIGPGCGTYARLLRPALPRARFVGIEVHRPYVERFGLDELYDELIVNDVRFMNNLPLADVVVLGDVLEHLRHDEALWLWEQCRMVARLGVFLSLPIYGYDQGELEGNVHETHLHQWSDEQVRSELDGIVDHQCWSIVGTYQAAPA